MYPPPHVIMNQVVKAVSLTLVVTGSMPAAGITTSGEVFILLDQQTAVERVQTGLVRRMLSLDDIKDTDKDDDD